MFTRTGNLLIACIMFLVLGNVISATADTEANKALVSRLFTEVFNQGNLEVIDELVAPEFVHHTAGAIDATGPEGYKELIGMLRVAFPDLNVVIEDMIAEGDIITTRQTYTGTHKGNLMNIPPTDVEVVFTGIGIFRIVDGKITKVWTEYDVLGLMLQLGVAETSPDWPPMNRQGKEDFVWTLPSDITGDPGDPAANIAVIHRINDEVVNLGKAEVIDETVATTFTNHDPVWPVIVTLEDYKPWQIGFSQWPDGHQTIDLIFAEGDKVVSYWTYTWMEAAVGTVEVTGVDIWRFADGKIVERWSSKDFFGMMQRMTPPDTGPNKALINRLFEEAYNQGKMDVVDEIVAPNFIHHTADEIDAKGSEGYKELIGIFRTAFPDLKVTIDDMIVEGNIVSTRQTYTGTHQGDFQGVSPTDVELVFTGTCTFQIVAGNIIETWTEYDVLGVMLQLGVMEPSPDWPPMNRNEFEDFVWTAPSDVTGDPGDPETNKAIVQRINDEVVNLGRAEPIDETIATDFVNHDPVWPVIITFEDYKPWQASFSQWPDGHQTINLMIATGDKVVSHWTYSWTEAAVGTVEVTGIDIWRFADGKIVER